MLFRSPQNPKTPKLYLLFENIILLVQMEAQDEVTYARVTEIIGKTGKCCNS